MMTSRYRVHFAALALGVALAVSSAPSRSATLYTASLDSTQNTNPTNSPGTGYGTVLLNDAQTQITVNESWVGLLAPVTASHIHTAPPGANGPVTFGFTGVPNSTTGSIPEQVFAINAAQLADLNAGNMYFNVHTIQFPGGEIRGQLKMSTQPVPEPGTLAMLLTSAPGVLLLLRRKRMS